MEVEELRSLLTLARHDRVTEAAEELRVTQPTLSRLLSRIEHELGARLFERDARGVRPNPYGDLVLAAARDIVARHDRMRRELAGLLDPDAGTVRLAFLDSIATSLVPRILRDFRLRAPRVRVDLSQEPAHEILSDLAAGAAEVAITAPRPDDARYDWLPLHTQRLVLVVPPGHRLARRRRVRVADLDGEDFVTLPRGFGFRTLSDALFAAAGATPRIAFESGDLATIEGLVGAGLGSAIVAEQFAGASGTIGIPLADPGTAREIGLTWRRDRPLAPPAARFVAHLRAAPAYD
ncbi:LysR family transcriptional regulator [Actinoplanes sp. RD1]|uniref:LysR family transcriptional regulator n=1 Tax=Actinoplanes sp. RD1 TaxID=3064538 RepID=UPI002740A5DF|nr:LysR family transcriptional regulator [Actinoplanes sp. RD1]